MIPSSTSTAVITSTQDLSAPAARTLKRQKVVHAASSPNKELVLSTVTHWLQFKWVSRAALLHVVKSYGKESDVNMEEKAEENIEGTSQVVGPENNSRVMALSPRMDDEILGMSHYT